MGICFYPSEEKLPDLYIYIALVPKTIRSNKKRHIKKLYKRTGWLKISKSGYRYMFNKDGGTGAE